MLLLWRVKVEHRIRSNYTIKIHMLLGHMYIACWISPFIGQSSFDNKLAFHISWIYEVSNINVVRYCSFFDSVYRNIYLYNYFPVWVNIKSILNITVFLCHSFWSVVWQFSMETLSNVIMILLSLWSNFSCIYPGKDIMFTMNHTTE